MSGQDDFLSRLEELWWKGIYVMATDGQFMIANEKDIRIISQFVELATQHSKRYSGGNNLIYELNHTTDELSITSPDENTWPGRLTKLVIRRAFKQPELAFRAYSEAYLTLYAAWKGIAPTVYGAFSQLNRSTFVLERGIPINHYLQHLAVMPSPEENAEKVAYKIHEIIHKTSFSCSLLVGDLRPHNMIWLHGQAKLIDFDPRFTRFMTPNYGSHCLHCINSILFINASLCLVDVKEQFHHIWKRMTDSYIYTFRTWIRQSDNLKQIQEGSLCQILSQLDEQQIR